MVALFVACGGGGDGAPPSAAPPSSFEPGASGVAGDAGVDEGGVLDSGTAEGGAPDAQGPSADAGPGDAGALDAGPDAGPTVFAIIGDFGGGGAREAAVEALVRTWHPEFIVTTGDNNYASATSGVASFDDNIGKFYGDFIVPYGGAHWDASAPAAKNRFWPTIGNHDWDIGPGFAYGDFFTLPGNERYYDVTLAHGSVHLTLLDSDVREPDGIEEGSVQAAWAEAVIKASPAPFQLVFYHHPAYASHPFSEPRMRWAFKAWGVDAYVTGHIHNYERLVVDGQQYFVNGQGGYGTANFGIVAAGSVARYNAQDGAQRVEVTADRMTFQYFDVNGTLIDEVSIDPSGAVVP